MKTSVLSKITENEVFDLNVYQLVRPPIVHNNRFDVGLMIIKETRLCLGFPSFGLDKTVQNPGSPLTPTLIFKSPCV